MDTGGDIYRRSFCVSRIEPVPVRAKVSTMGKDANHPETSYRRETSKGERASFLRLAIEGARRVDLTNRYLVSQGTSNGSGGDNDNDNNNDRGKSTLRDAESGTSRHNGLKLTMPTISASVAPSRFLENESGHGGNGTGSASGSGSANGSGTGNATPNTTTTSLSRRHPSEDTTLDYAYDNPAMTPSPETVQHRTKRESSF